MFYEYYVDRNLQTSLWIKLIHCIHNRFRFLQFNSKRPNGFFWQNWCKLYRVTFVFSKYNNNVYYYVPSLNHCRIILWKTFMTNCVNRQWNVFRVNYSRRIFIKYRIWEEIPVLDSEWTEECIGFIIMCVAFFMFVHTISTSKIAPMYTK